MSRMMMFTMRVFDMKHFGEVKYQQEYISLYDSFVGARKYIAELQEPKRVVIVIFDSHGQYIRGFSTVGDITKC